MSRVRDSINFVASTVSVRRTWAGASIAAVAMAAGAVAWAMHMREGYVAASIAWERAQGRQRELDDQQVQLRARAIAINQRLQALDGAAAPWIAARNFAWDEALIPIERLDIPGVRLQRLLAVPDIGRIQFEMGADTPDAVLHVLKHLNGELTGETTLNAWRIERLQQSANTISAYPVVAIFVHEPDR